MNEGTRWFYQTREWKRCRASYRKQAGGLCERCKANGAVNAGVIVHHIKPITEANVCDPSVTLNTENLMLVCRKCHNEIHEGVEKRFSLDEMGRVIIDSPL